MICKRCNVDKEPTDFYNRLRVCKKCKIIENGERKKIKDYKYDQKSYYQKVEVVDDKTIRSEIIGALFPDGIIPKWITKKCNKEQ